MEWRAAETRAREAELVLFRAYLDHARGNGASPSPELEASAKALREECSRKFDAAMSGVDTALLACQVHTNARRL
jgi:hypothetical protein